MICIECGGKYIDKHGTVVLSGISLEGVDYTECAQCGNRLFPYETCEEWSKLWRERQG
jgi:DNA-directed RNA polymerase subunit RPC12/RpoP